MFTRTIVRLLYPLAWVRIRMPHRPKSKLWFTAKWEAEFSRNRARWRAAGRPSIKDILDAST